MITVNTDYSRCPRTKPIARQIPKPIFGSETEIHWVHKKPAALRAAGLLTTKLFLLACEFYSK